MRLACLTRVAHLEVLCDAGVVVILQGGKKTGPDDVGLGRPREGGGRSQLQVGKGKDIIKGLHVDLKLSPTESFFINIECSGLEALLARIISEALEKLEKNSMLKGKWSHHEHDDRHGVEVEWGPGLGEPAPFKGLGKRRKSPIGLKIWDADSKTARAFCGRFRVASILCLKV